MSSTLDLFEEAATQEGSGGRELITSASKEAPAAGHCPPAPSAPDFESTELAPIVPLTDAEWTRVLRGHRFRILVDEVKLAWAGKRAVRCMGCRHAGKTGIHEPWRGWCLVHRVMVSNLHPKLCREHVAA